jgi:hypothetical protein
MEQKKVKKEGSGWYFLGFTITLCLLALWISWLIYIMSLVFG